MRFPFRRKKEPRWVDTPDFAWVPDQPFVLVPGNDARREPAAASVPQRPKPQPASGPDRPPF